MTKPPLIYLDNNATTRVAPEVIAAMEPFFTEQWGNPSSAYGFGRRVAAHVAAAREQAAALLRAQPNEIVFTSGGTESINTALAAALRADPAKRHVLTTAVEHPATLNFCRDLERRGYAVTYLPVLPDGSLDLGRLLTAIRPDTAVVSVMWANNETGAIFPIPEIAALCRSQGALFHTDAVQAAGKVELDVPAAGCDFLSLSGHKLHAPKGIGLLYVRRGVPFHPYVIGGHQERGRRGGTENVPAIVGFGRAAELARAHRATEQNRVRALRDRLETGLLAAVPGCRRNGAAEPRLPNTANLAFPGIDAEALLLLLDQAGICASSGSACAAGSAEPSPVLTAMGVPPEHARGSVRFSLSRYTTDADVDAVLDRLPGFVAQLRGLASASPAG